MDRDSARLYWDGASKEDVGDDDEDDDADDDDADDAEEEENDQSLAYMGCVTRAIVGVLLLLLLGCGDGDGDGDDGEGSKVRVWRRIGRKPLGLPRRSAPGNREILETIGHVLERDVLKK